MLVLSRREGERIRIGDSITVTVVRCAGDKVRIGIEAPPDMLILRGELELYNKREGTVRKIESPIRPPIGAPVDYPIGASVPTTVF
ncbi:MAG: carbon storage regulator [Planctomycetaceae bacterium]|nr:carbon storage regulator [Planctomycetaceae bacterium]